MPPDCEIHWREHRPSIKGRNIFSKMLNFSSTHQTVNMKLFLLFAVCLAGALALPAQKEKRDILPGDPRYGTDYHQHHHQHHENEVEISRAAGGYAGSYTVPATDVQKNSFQVIRNGYGPPHHQPGPPLNNAYLSPVVDVKHTTPVSTYGPPVTEAQPTVQDVKQTHPPITSYGVPETKTNIHTVESELKTPTVTAPITSYGEPAVTDVKTSEKNLFENAGTHTTYTKVEKTVIPQTDVHQISVHEQQTLVNPGAKVVGQTQGGVQSTFSGNLGSETYTSQGPKIADFARAGSFDAVNYGKLTNLKSQISLPTTFYTGAQSTFGSGFDGSFTGNHHFGSLDGHLSLKQHYPVHQAQHIPYTVPLPHTVQVPRPYYVRVSQPVGIPVEVPHTSHLHHQFIQTKTPEFHGHVQVQKGPISDFIQGNLPNFQETLSNLQLPSFQLPSLPFFKPTEAPHVPVPSSVDTVHVPSANHDSVTIENPVQTVLTETKHEYVQPTDENGGYIY